MPIREVLGKSIALGLVVAALVVGGILVLIGSHPYNDYLNTVLGWGLIAIGIASGGGAVLLIGSILYDARLRQEESEVHITPRGAPPAPPPPWGMGDVGRPGGGVVQVADRAPRGGGAPRVMSVSVSNIDGPLFIVALLAWTVITLVFFAPTH